MTNLSTIIPITDLRRNFGAISKKLTEVDELILTKAGEPFAILKAAPGEKRKLLTKASGSWKGTKLDDDKFWSDVLKRKSRKSDIFAA